MMSHVFPSRDEVHWSRTALAAPACQVLSEDIECDVVIVGAGLTGLRTAVGLAEAGVNTVVIDAGDIGHGASGRSGGQCNPIWRSTPDQLREKFGQDQAERLIQATLTAADDLFDDIGRLNINCGAEQNGWFQAAHTSGHAKGLEKLRDSWRTVGADIETVSSSDVVGRAGTTAYEFGLFHKKGGFVQPLSLTRGYARAAQREGARLYNRTKATSMQRIGGRWYVATERGGISAEKVVLTTNAYTDRLWPKLSQTLLPLISIALATRPLTPTEQATVLPGRATISDTRLAIYFARYDADNRLIFGCVGSTEKSSAFWGHRRLSKGLTTVFPQLDGVEIECTWAGKIGVTTDMMPKLYEPEPGVLAGLGFSGRGIAMTSVMGRTLARRVLGGSNSELPFPVEGLSSVPLHTVAKRVVPLMAPAMSVVDEANVIRDRRTANKRRSEGKT